MIILADLIGNLEEKYLNKSKADLKMMYRDPDIINLITSLFQLIKIQNVYVNTICQKKVEEGFEIDDSTIVLLGNLQLSLNRYIRKTDILNENK